VNHGRLVIVFAALIAFSHPATSAERKAPQDINAADLTTETQKMSDAPRVMDLAWWVTAEFWSAVLSQDPSVPEEVTEEMLKTIRPFFIVAVVQADISIMGAFNFIEEPKIRRGLRVEYANADGDRQNLPLLETTSNDFELLLLQFGPMLGAAMGNLGQNFQFYAFSAFDEDGNRIASPYETGILQVSLHARDGEPSVFEFEAPLDALYVPRMCPNGKPAHITWNVCPWSGTKPGR